MFFDAIFGISLPLISKSKAVRQMAGFWVINSHSGGILDHDPMGVMSTPAENSDLKGC